MLRGADHTVLFMLVCSMGRPVQGFTTSSVLRQNKYRSRKISLEKRTGNFKARMVPVCSSASPSNSWPDRPDIASSANYLDLLTRYSDDGYTLSAPQRYCLSDWYDNLMSIPSCLVLVRVRSHLVFNFIWSVIMTGLCYSGLPPLFGTIPAPPVFDKLNLYLPFAMSGGILGILLAFRTSQSYERFWKGRQIWAKVINTVRSFVRMLKYLDNPEPDFIPTIKRWIGAFPTALMQHLRGQRSVSDLTTLSTQDLRLMEASDNMPICCIMVLTELINQVKLDKSQSASGLLWWQMEEYCRELMDCIGQGEAIAGTPVPLSYSRHTSRLLSIWTIFCPFVFVQCLPPLLVPVVTVIVSWMLLATEEIGHVIEEPFGIHDDRPNILPLQRYCDVIVKDVDIICEENSMIAAYSIEEEKEKHGLDAMPVYDAPETVLPTA